MFESHEIDLALTYTQDENVYLRFRLHADQASNGWGWAIDNVEVDNIISALENEQLITNRFKLIGNYPNPFNPNTTIRFTLAENGSVSLKLYNYLGQLVKTLYSNESFSSGTIHQVYWDGNNDFGQPVASGTYFYKLNSGQNQMIKKMVLMR